MHGFTKSMLLQKGKPNVSPTQSQATGTGTVIRSTAHADSLASDSNSVNDRNVPTEPEEPHKLADAGLHVGLNAINDHPDSETSMAVKSEICYD